MKNLYRSKKNRWLGGVLGGLSEYFQIDPSLLRIIVIVAAVMFGLAAEFLIVYFIAWILLPSDKHMQWYDETEEELCVSEKNKQKSSREIIGIVIILIGLAIFFRQLLPAHWMHINRHAFFASLLVISGLFILLRGKK
jgi:phage shock protein C